MHASNKNPSSKTSISPSNIFEMTASSYNLKEGIVVPGMTV